MIVGNYPSKSLVILFYLTVLGLLNPSITIRAADVHPSTSNLKEKQPFIAVLPFQGQITAQGKLVLNEDIGNYLQFNQYDVYRLLTKDDIHPTLVENLEKKPLACSLGITSPGTRNINISSQNSMSCNINLPIESLVEEFKTSNNQNVKLLLFGNYQDFWNIRFYRFFIYEIRSGQYFHFNYLLYHSSHHQMYSEISSFLSKIIAILDSGQINIVFTIDRFELINSKSDSSLFNFQFVPEFIRYWLQTQLITNSFPLALNKWHPYTDKSIGSQMVNAPESNPKLKPKPKSKRFIISGKTTISPSSIAIYLKIKDHENSQVHHITSEGTLSDLVTTLNKIFSEMEAKLQFSNHLPFLLPQIGISVSDIAVYASISAYYGLINASAFIGYHLGSHQLMIHVPLGINLLVKHRAILSAGVGPSMGFYQHQSNRSILIGGMSYISASYLTGPIRFNITPYTIYIDKINSPISQNHDLVDPQNFEWGIIGGVSLPIY